MTNQILNAADAILPTDKFKFKNAERDDFVKSWTKFHTGALFGFLGGLLFLTGAIFLTVFEYLSGEKSHGNWLYFFPLPLLILGAHCLDKISETSKAKREAKFIKNTK